MNRSKRSRSRTHALPVTGAAMLSIGMLVAPGCFQVELCDFATCTGGGTESAGGAGATSPTGGNASGAGGTGAQGGDGGVLAQGGGGGDGGEGGEGGATGGGGGGPGFECDPDLLAAGEPIAEECGIFVLPGAVGGFGTQAEPFGTLDAALELAVADGDRIYVCSTLQSVDEAVSLDQVVRLYGGVSCADWTRTPTNTEWTAAANEIPLRIQPNANGSLVQGFHVTARNASGFQPATLQGNSSIAMWIQGAGIELKDMDIEAGLGADGGAGTSPAGQAAGRQSMAALFDGSTGGACALPGGAQKTFSCPSGDSSGGKGGDGMPNNGLAGSPGLPDLMMGPPIGAGGIGEPNVGGWTCAMGGFGGSGHPGVTGAFGAGGGMTGALDLTDGYQGEPGQAGQLGGHAQGGGGGGGRRGNLNNGCALLQAGPGGGGGGVGGCAGVPATGGGAGGASIALVSDSASLTLTDVTLTAATGGAGGAGGDGQPGGVGGNGGIGACTGGAGGAGGKGGAGGGGAGGPSMGLVYDGTMPVISLGDITVPPMGASGGLGGDAIVAANGLDGPTLAVVALPLP